jgi:hypothetical protein
MKLISKPLTAALAIAAAAIVITPIALASTSGSAQARPVVIPPACGNAHPSSHDGAFVWGADLGDRFAGGTGFVVEITNEGRHTCSLRGAPGAAVQSNGHLIGGKIPASGKSPLITLKPGATAYFRLTTHEALAVCAHPVDGMVVIYLPGQRQPQNSWMDARACPRVPIGELLNTGTFTPGIGVPWYNA